MSLFIYIKNNINCDTVVYQRFHFWISMFTSAVIDTPFRASLKSIYFVKNNL